jgi:hypothetical protein
MTEAEKAAEKAVKTFHDLEAKRALLIERGAKLADERRAIAYDAHADGDAKARKRLDQVNAEVATHASELASLDDAIEAAHARAAAAIADVEREKERENALALRAVVNEFAECGRALDAALDQLVAASDQLREHVDRIHALGVNSPSHEQVEVLGYQALLTALNRTRWDRRFERLAPNQRRTFEKLVEGWCAQLERAVAHREAA